MDIHALKTVLLVQDLGSIAKAARALDLDASSVSRIVAGVERDIGLRLFQRSTRKLAITEEGAHYLQRVAPLVEELEAAREDAAGLSGEPRGRLRMTASVAFVQEALMPLLPAFQKKHPELSVDLFPSDSNLDLLAEGLDLAVRLSAAPRGDLISTKLMPTRYRVVASPDYLAQSARITHPAELAEHNCLCFALPHFQTRWHFRTRGGDPFPVEVSGKTVIASALSLREAARLGMGVALLADWLIRDDLNSRQLVDLFPELDCAASDFDTAAWLLYPSRSYLPQKVRVMIDFLKAELR